MVFDPGLVFSGISALSGLVQAWKTAREMGKTLEPSEVDRSVEEHHVQIVASTLAPIVDNEILEAILENIKRAKDRLIKAMKNRANSDETIDDEMEIASSTICSELGRIKRLNGGKLPDVEGVNLESLWISHKCG